MEEPILFENKNGKKLFGILHIPDETDKFQLRIGINIVNPGIKYRVAPHRLNVKLARQFCRLGYYVLRFDPAGIGDSEGDLPEGMPIGDIWHNVQSGLFVEDTLSANNMFIAKYKLDRLIVMGNCGGAITALLSGARDIRVNGLVLVDVPVIMWSSERSVLETAVGNGEKLDHYFGEYVKRLFRLESWYRLLTFKTDYRGLWYTLKMKLMKKIHFLKKKNDSEFNWVKFIDENKINPHFIQSIDHLFTHKKPILFISGGNDPGRDSFHNLFEKTYLMNKYGSDNSKYLYEIFLIPDANHIYTFLEWQSTLLSKIESWVKKNYPVT